MRIVGSDGTGRAVVSRPSGLEKSDAKEILRLRYLGMLSGPPENHFIGTDPERSFGGSGHGLRERWERVRHQFYGGHRDEALWREAYHEIGRVCAWLDLPSYIREEVTRIYANLKARGKTSGKHRTLEEVLAKITYLACLIHRLPRKREDIERGIRELYGFGIGKIPREFVKAANTRTRWFWAENKNGRPYLRCQDKFSGEKILLGKF
jgi:hypothetical protein